MSKPKYLDIKKPVWVITGNTHGLWGKPEKYTYRCGQFGIKMWMPVKKSTDDCLNGDEYIGLNSDGGFFRFISYEQNDAEVFYLGAKTALTMLKELVSSAEN